MKNDNLTKMIFRVNYLVTYCNKSLDIMKNVGLRHFFGYFSSLSVDFEGRLV